jgi:hypothetical protein
VTNVVRFPWRAICHSHEDVMTWLRWDTSENVRLSLLALGRYLTFECPSLEAADLAVMTFITVNSLNVKYNANCLATFCKYIGATPRNFNLGEERCVPINVHL